MAEIKFKLPQQKKYWVPKEDLLEAKLRIKENEPPPESKKVTLPSPWYANIPWAVLARSLGMGTPFSSLGMYADIAQRFPQIGEFQRRLGQIVEYPFSVFGMSHRVFRENIEREERGLPPKTLPPRESILPGGKTYEEYRELPMGKQLALESPAIAASFLLPLGGGRKGVKFPKKVPAPTKAIEKVTPAVEQVPKPLAIDKFTQILKQAEATLPKTRVLRTAERKARVAKAAQELEKEGLTAEQAFIRAKAKLKGELPLAEMKGELPQITEQEFSELLQFIRVNPKLRVFEKIHLESAVKALSLGQAPQRNQIKLLKEILGIDVSMLKTGVGRKAWNIFLNLVNLPRAVITSIDLSGFLRQGVILTARRPIVAAKGIRPMLKQFAREKWAQEIDDVMRADPLFPVFTEQRSKGFELFIAPLKGTLTQREEVYMSQWTRYIPGVRHSERAFIGILNHLRFNSAKETYKVWERMGVATDKNLDWLCRLINIAGGRGEIGPLKGMAPFLNAMLFSLRLFLSRWQYPMMLLDPRVPKHVRIEHMKQLISFLGAGTGILSMLKLTGAADVETDPRSADFLKARIGNTRLDIWGGFQQHVRFCAQMATMERLTSEGKMADVTRDELIFNFLQSKFSPIMGLFWDIMRGKSYMGEEMSLEREPLLKQIRNRLVPLFIQDMIDAYEDLGIQGLGIALPGILGVGVVTYGGGRTDLGPRIGEVGTGQTLFSQEARDKLFNIPQAQGGRFSEIERQKLFGR